MKLGNYPTLADKEDVFHASKFLGSAKEIPCVRVWSEGLHWTANENILSHQEHCQNPSNDCHNCNYQLLQVG